MTVTSGTHLSNLDDREPENVIFRVQKRNICENLHLYHEELIMFAGEGAIAFDCLGPY